MKNIVILLFLSIAALSFPARSLEISGEFSQEVRYYPQEGAVGNTDQSEMSLIVKPDIGHSWDEDRKVINFIPFYRFTDPDDEKTHGDIREASFVGSWDTIELRAGVSQVFWGVTEGLHLVNIVNQTDFVENPDGEDKLGQPMINPTLVTEYGNLSYFFLPYFRERTFSGPEGRFQGPLIVDTDNPIYTHEDEERHIDHALRYGHYFGDLEFALSYFRGTDRDPLFFIDGDKIRPLYVQAEQFGLDAQYIYESWLFKLEAIRRDQETQDPYFATAAGFEYTFSNIFGGMDIGAPRRALL